MLLLSLLALPVLSASSSPPATLTKIDLATFPLARCLDGSASGFYTASSLSSDDKKFVFSLQGGGECTANEDCQSRAKGDLGSSNHWASTLDIEGQRFLSKEEDDNPFWFDATHVRIMYCSGELRDSLHSIATFTYH